MSNGINIVAHNLQGMFANRQLGIVSQVKEKSTEKLSSGYRINRAADDAAGLAISEKMRRQIRGLTQGTLNAQDGVSMCQIADGALNEASDMLHRITELSIQSSNGTYTLEDRQAIQKEVDAILLEIDRISTTTTFNEQQIFIGEMQISDSSDTEGDDTSELIMPTKGYCVEQNWPERMHEDDYWPYFPADVQVTEVDAGTELRADCQYYAETSVSDISRIEQEKLIANKRFVLASLSENQGNIGTYYTLIKEVYYGDTVPTDLSDDVMAFYDYDLYSIPYGQGKVWNGSNVLSAALDMTFLGDNGQLCSVQVDTMIGGFYEEEANFIFKGNYYNKYYSLATNHSQLGRINRVYYNSTSDYRSLCDVFDSILVSDKDVAVLNKYNGTIQILAAGSDLTGYVKEDGTGDSYYAVVNPTPVDGNSLNTDAGGETKEGGKSFWIQSGAEAGDGIYLTFGRMDTDILGIQGLNVTTETGAADSIERTKEALSRLNGIRSSIGAQQNRLEHTIKHQENTIENTQQAESLIRDTDMASEMMRFSATNIIQQAGQAMLTQANQSNQGVLTLLQ